MYKSKPKFKYEIYDECILIHQGDQTFVLDADKHDIEDHAKKHYKDLLEWEKDPDDGLAVFSIDEDNYYEAAILYAHDQTEKWQKEELITV